LRLFERKVTRFGQRDAAQKYPLVLIGFRKGGHEFMRTFNRMGKKYVVVDYDPENIEILERKHTHVVYGDATDPELLDELNLDESKLIVSTIGDNETNMFLARWLSTHNPGAVFVCTAERAEYATELYDEGVAYVMMPHYIGSEKINNFIRRNGLKKSEFKNFRDKHLEKLHNHIEEIHKEEDQATAAA